MARTLRMHVVVHVDEVHAELFAPGWAGLPARDVEREKWNRYFCQSRQSCLVHTQPRYPQRDLLSTRGSRMHHGPSVSGTNVVAVWRAFQEVSLDKRRQNDAAGVAVECPEAPRLSFSELQPWHFDVLAPHTHKKCGHAWSRSSLAALSFNSFGNHCSAHVCHRPRSGEGTSVIHVTRLVLVEPDVLPSPRNECETVSSR